MNSFGNRDRCRRGHKLTNKTVRWRNTKTKGLERQCRLCESMMAKLRYRAKKEQREGLMQ